MEYPAAAQMSAERVTSFVTLVSLAKLGVCDLSRKNNVDSLKILLLLTLITSFVLPCLDAVLPYVTHSPYTHHTQSLHVSLLITRQELDVFLWECPALASGERHSTESILVFACVFFFLKRKMTFEISRGLFVLPSGGGEDKAEKKFPPFLISVWLDWGRGRSSKPLLIQM